ncbi:hypothetical protein BC832DRAFT_430298 [Gaertneriomyces semiglobifer]|nr:hypothetical protein BC832DRAFT_430298 [Gaertneriomyces semiglobifer]
MSTKKRKGATTKSGQVKRLRSGRITEFNDAVERYAERENARHFHGFYMLLDQADVTKPLTDFAIEVIAKNFPKLVPQPGFVRRMDLLAPQLISKLLVTLSKLYPDTLTPEILVTCFLARQAGSFDRLALDKIPSSRHSLVWNSLASEEMLTQLKELCVNAVEVGAGVLVNAIKNMPQLTVFESNSNRHLDDRVVQALKEHCPLLRKIDIGYTSVTHRGVAYIFCMNAITVVKCTGINVGGTKAWESFEQNNPDARPQLTHLKLRGCEQMTSDGLAIILRIAGPQLQSLDISEPAPSVVLTFQTLEPCLRTLVKLNVAGVNCRNAQFLNIMEALHNNGTLTKLTMTESNASRSFAMRGTRHNKLSVILPYLNRIRKLFINCTDLVYLTPVLKAVPNIEALDVSDNVCNPIDFVDIPDQELESMLPCHKTLVHLNLSRTRVDDRIVPFLKRCQRLKTLLIESTQLTASGIRDVIQACPQLEELLLTGCRAIPPRERRDFFAKSWAEFHGEIAE